MTSKSNIRRWRAAWLAGLMALGLAVPAMAHDPLAVQRLPSWVVLVLKLVSDTHVEPTTGIVVSSEGHVLVPAEFTADGAPLVVLDGGVDVLRNGRPAVLLERFRLEGLALLQVEHLAREPVSYASGLPEAGDPVLLLAFPPAELISAGETRIAQLADVPPNGQLGEELALPNVTGALVNGCDQLVGLSAARGVQSLSTGANTLYHGLDTLAGLLARSGLPLSTSPCAHSLAPHAPPVEAEPAAAEEVPAEPPIPEPEVVDEVIDTPPEPEPEVEPESELVTPEPDTADTPPDVLDPKAELDTPAADEEGELGVEDTAPLDEETASPPLDEDADTGPESLAAEDAADGQAMGQEATDQSLLPAWAWWLLGGLLVTLIVVWTVFRGRPAADKATPIALWLQPDSGDAIPVSLRKGVVEVTLGRFETDVVLKGSSISRRHARLTGTPRALFIVDLGSSNGTKVNGNECEAGRSVPLVAGDEVRLGDQVFHLRLPDDGDGGE